MGELKWARPKYADIILSEDSTSVHRKGSNGWHAVIGERIYQTGVHRFMMHVDADAVYRIGVAAATANFVQFESNKDRWYLHKHRNTCVKMHVPRMTPRTFQWQKRHPLHNSLDRQPRGHQIVGDRQPRGHHIVCTQRDDMKQ